MITAKIIACSVAKDSGTEIVTYELEYPRFIHSEFMTHRMFSRNAASSRAIPIQKMIRLIKDNPVVPFEWGSKRPGMQAGDELKGWRLTVAKTVWKMAMYSTINFVEVLDFIGLHKQVSNRLLEPYSHIKVIMTTTEMKNFMWLRDHADAQPEIHELARRMSEARSKFSSVNELQPGDWHLPYIRVERLDSGEILYFSGHDEVSLEDAKMISASCCAQVSYRVLDGGLDKAKMIYDRLVSATPVHASPFEHQAMAYAGKMTGVTHTDSDGGFWSGNLRGYIQMRQLIQGNYVPG